MCHAGLQGAGFGAVESSNGPCLRNCRVLYEDDADVDDYSSHYNEEDDDDDHDDDADDGAHDDDDGDDDDDDDDHVDAAADDGDDDDDDDDDDGRAMVRTDRFVVMITFGLLLLGISTVIFEE